MQSLTDIAIKEVYINMLNSTGEDRKKFINSLPRDILEKLYRYIIQQRYKAYFRGENQREEFTRENVLLNVFFKKLILNSKDVPKYVAIGNNILNFNNIVELYYNNFSENREEFEKKVSGFLRKLKKESVDSIKMRVAQNEKDVIDGLIDEEIKFKNIAEYLINFDGEGPVNESEEQFDERMFKLAKEWGPYEISQLYTVVNAVVLTLMDERISQEIKNDIINSIKVSKIREWLYLKLKNLSITNIKEFYIKYANKYLSGS